MLMRDATYSKAFSKHISPDDFRREHINKFRLENQEITMILEQIAAWKSELVEKTPYDLYENKIAIEMITKGLQSIYNLIESNPELTREYLEEAILPMQDWFYWTKDL